jgi:triacylglycerol lipase
MGWPHGQVVGMPAATADVGAQFTGLDRLRWLCAGALPLTVINMEPAADLALRALSSVEDRAEVIRRLHPGDDPWTLLGDRPAGSSGRLELAVRPSRAVRVTRHPVVFCHGMLAMSTMHMQVPEDANYFSALRPLLKERGFRALYPRVSPTGGIVARAHELREQIRRWTDEPVNIIAHSMGGLDARYLITNLGMGSQVRTLTTIATSHRGTWLADWFVANYRNHVPVLRAMEMMGIDVDGFRDCQPAAVAAFNAQTPDVPGVTYYSYGAAVQAGRISPMLRRPWALLTPVEGPNDGMVSVASARWGEYLGTIAADHFAQTPDGAFVRPGEDFDSLGFCMKVVEELAYRGW